MMFGPPPVCRNCEYAHQIKWPWAIKWYCQHKESERIDPESPGCEDFNYSPEVIQ